MRIRSFLALFHSLALGPALGTTLALVFSQVWTQAFTPLALASSSVVDPVEFASLETSCQIEVLKSHQIDSLILEGKERAKAQKNLLTLIKAIEKERGEQIGLWSVGPLWQDIAGGELGVKIRSEQKPISEAEWTQIFTTNDAEGLLKFAFTIRNFRSTINNAAAKFMRWANEKLDRAPKPVKNTVGGVTTAGGWASEKVGKAAEYLVRRGSKPSAQRGINLFRKVKSKIRSTALFVTDFLWPFPLKENIERWTDKTASVFQKLEKNKDYQPTLAETEILKQYDAVDAFNERQKFVRANPKFVKVKNFWYGLKRWATLGFLATALNLTTIQTAYTDHPVVMSEEYFKSDDFKLAPNQVQLINETFPFPHLALRYGNQVYSYSVENVQNTSATVYLSSHLYEKAGYLRDKKEVPFLTNASASLRSVQVVTLNLTEEEAASLVNYLKLQVGKKYENITLVNDCSTMIARAIREHTHFDFPALIDPSPSSVMSYFALKKQMGDPAIGKMELLLGNQNQVGSLHYLRNLYINMREQRLFADYFNVYLPYRGYVEMAYSKEDLQHFDKEVIGEMSKWRDGKQLDSATYWDGAIASIKNDGELSIWIEGRDRILRPQDKENRELVASLFSERYADLTNALNAPTTDIFGTIDILYTLQSLAEVEEYLLGSSSFNLDDAVSDPKYAAELKELLGTLGQGDSVIPLELLLKPQATTINNND